MTTVITVAFGDGPMGPKIMEAALYILREAGAHITIETIEIGERIYNMGSLTGILPGAWDSLNRTHILLKSPTKHPTEDGARRVTDVLRESPELVLFEATEETLPSMLSAAAAMLRHIDQPSAAERIEQALAHTLSKPAYEPGLLQRLFNLTPDALTAQRDAICAELHTPTSHRGELPV